MYCIFFVIFLCAVVFVIVQFVCSVVLFAYLFVLIKYFYCRIDFWWNNIVLRTFILQDWLENFWMSKETFLYICGKLAQALTRTDTLLRKCLSVERRVAVTLWCLATPTEYRTLAHLFGIASLTVCETVHEVCHGIVVVLLNEYIKFPSGNHLDCIVDEFKTKWSVPQCIVAIDGCHIPTSAPLKPFTH